MNNLNPGQLADKLMTLSENFSRCSEALANLARSEAEYYKVNRDKHKSDTAVERHFMATEEGILMLQTKLKLKSIAREMSAIKTFIEVKSNEARGLY